MKELTMSLAKHTNLKRMHKGTSAGIHEVLKGAGFDIEKDYSVGQDKKTGDFIFMQAEPKKEKPPDKKKGKK